MILIRLIMTHSLTVDGNYKFHEGSNPGIFGISKFSTKNNNYVL